MSHGHIVRHRAVLTGQLLRGRQRRGAALPARSIPERDGPVVVLDVSRGVLLHRRHRDASSVPFGLVLPIGHADGDGVLVPERHVQQPHAVVVIVAMQPVSRRLLLQLDGLGIAFGHVCRRLLLYQWLEHVDTDPGRIARLHVQCVG